MSRECGTCAECCWALGITELKKPPFVRCQHIIKRDDGEGCEIYGEHPPTCQGFQCGWLQGRIDEEYKPDKMGVVVFTQPGSNYTGMVQAAESRKGALDTEEGKMFRKYLRKQFHWIVVRRWYRKKYDRE